MMLDNTHALKTETLRDALNTLRLGVRRASATAVLSSGVLD